MVCTPLCKGLEYVTSVSVCVRTHISETIRPKLHQTFVHVACDCSLVLTRRRCKALFTSGFVDDVAFSSNGQTLAA